MDRATRPLVIIGAFAASLAVGLLLMMWLMGGLKNVAAPAAIGGPFQLTDQAGQTVTDQNLKGRPTLIFFGFTHCPDVCPTSLFEISEVLKAMGTDADKVNACLDEREKLIAGKEADLEAALAEYHQALAAAVGEQAARLDMTLKAVADVAERVRSLQAS